METIASKERVDRIRRRLQFQFSFYVATRGLSRRLGLFWNNSLKVQVLDSCKNFIQKGTPMYILRSSLCIEILDINKERRELSRDISNLNKKENITWCCIRDFNAMLHPFEKDGLCPMSR